MTRSRPVLHLLTTLSLLLTAIAGVAWVRSHWYCDTFLYASENGHLALQWVKGQLVIGDDNIVGSRHGFSFDSWPVKEQIAFSVPGNTWLARRGFWLDHTSTGGRSVLRLGLPLWGIAVAGLLLPLALVPAALRRRARRRDGLCLECGYSLRETTDICPRCGVAPIR